MSHSATLEANPQDGPCQHRVFVGSHHCPQCTAFSLARPSKRLVAWLIDMLLLMIYRLGLLALIRSVASVSSVMSILLIIPYFLVDLIYFPCLQASKEQASVGMKVMRLQLCMEDGTPVRFGTAFLRTLYPLLFSLTVLLATFLLTDFSTTMQHPSSLIPLILALPLLFLWSFLMCLQTEKQQTLYDKLTKSLVIKKR